MSERPIRVEKVNRTDNTSSHLSNIDLLRILAALSVVVFHLFGEFTLRNYHSEFLHFALRRYGFFASGVDIFFLISGFVIARSSFLHKKNSKKFIKERIRRIVPSYYIVTIFTLVSFEVSNYFKLSKIPIPSLREILMSFALATTYLKSGHPVVQQGWTLEFEFLFYGCVTVALLQRRTFLKNIVLLCALFCTMVLLPNHVVMLEFIAGMGIAWAHRHFRFGLPINALLSLIGLGWLFTIFIFGIQFSSRLAFIFPYSLLLFGAVSLPQLRWTGLRKLGGMSYPIYLVQGLVVPLCYQYIKRKTDFSFADIFFVVSSGLISSASLGFFLYRFVDQPISTMLRRTGW